MAMKLCLQPESLAHSIIIDILINHFSYANDHNLVKDDKSSVPFFWIGRYLEASALEYLMPPLTGEGGLG